MFFDVGSRAKWGGGGALHMFFIVVMSVSLSMNGILQ